MIIYYYICMRSTVRRGLHSPIFCLIKTFHFHFFSVIIFYSASNARLVLIPKSKGDMGPFVTCPLCVLDAAGKFLEQML